MADAPVGPTETDFAEFGAVEVQKLSRIQQLTGSFLHRNWNAIPHVTHQDEVDVTDAEARRGVTGLTRSVSLEGRRWDITCGQIDIGNAATSLTENFSDGAVQADGGLRPEPMMTVAEVVKAVVFMADLPLDANVQFMTILATKMPYVGRG